MCLVFEDQRSKRLITIINIQLHEGSKDQDQGLRMQQLSNLKQEIKKIPAEHQNRIIVAGDFNADLMPISVWAKSNLGLSYNQDHMRTQYNTENRV